MTALAEERRHWIPNPVGHRLAESRQYYGRDGEMVDTVFGEAVLIVPPQPAAEDWYCDLCSELILTKWGDQPFPVPMFGSYAMCMAHYNEAVAEWKHDTDEGDVSDVPMGEWPLLACTCDPCISTLHGWMKAQAERMSEGRS